MQPVTADQPHPNSAPALLAPTGWARIDFVSDVHLQANDPATAAAFLSCLQRSTAQAIFVLGDLFEVWVGDDGLDDADSFEATCAKAIADAARHRPIYLMVGNRDFLLGGDFLRRTGCIALADPTVLVAQDQRWLLSHGDALCLDDTRYQAFRAQVRAAAWQDAFLTQALAARRAQARAMREASQAHQAHQAQQAAALGRPVEGWADVDHTAALAWLQDAHANVLIHGHTHRPAEHNLAPGYQRVVLSDWDAAAQPPRCQVLRLQDGALSRIDLTDVA